MEKLNLKKLREVGKNATQGPWGTVDGAIYTAFNIKKYIWTDSFGRSGLSEGPELITEPYKGAEDYQNNHNNHFIVKARNNWEALIEALKDAKSFIYKLRDEYSFDDTTEDQFLEWLERFEDEANR